MKRALVASGTAMLALVLAAGCRSSGDFGRAETQREIGVRMAKMNLWREAMFRFQRAIEIEPGNAMTHNNLAVAYEANGDFEGAAREYREALRLDRSNQYIQKNYSRFVEFTQKSKKRDEAKPAAPAETPPQAVPAAAPEGAPPARLPDASQPEPPAPDPDVPAPQPDPPPPGPGAAPALGGAR